ncbi:MAG: hypothetical protein M1401_01775 [Chloroflexi bacterium]|nr:hypothetical protein [Chloroflexota bacterium]
MPEAGAVERLWQRIAEPLYEDERLRGALDDAAFQLLLDWALAAAKRCAGRAAGARDPVAEAETCSAQLRRLVFLAARAAVDGRRDELLLAVAPPVFDAGEEAAARKALAEMRLGSQPNENAGRLALALRAGR